MGYEEKATYIDLAEGVEYFGPGITEEELKQLNEELNVPF